MENIKRWIRNYFNFNQRETNGFILLLLILAIVAIVPFLWDNSDKPYDPAADRQTLDSLAAQLQTSPYESDRLKKKIAVVKPIPPTLLRPFETT